MGKHVQCSVNFYCETYTVENTSCLYHLIVAGRRATLLVVGLTSLVLYTFYTSSVVSWLLNAVPPTIASLDGLIQSDLELVFEDVGYTRSWLFVCLSNSNKNY